MYKLYENVLEKNYFQELQQEFNYGSNIPWYFNGSTIKDSIKYKEDNQFMFTHNIYSNNEVKSNLFEHLTKLSFTIANIVNKNNLLRIKANMYTNQGTSKSHSKHTDFPDMDNYITAVFNFTTCNGGTLLYVDDKEINFKSKENSLLVFDGKILHNGYTQTDTHNRVLINYDFN